MALKLRPSGIGSGIDKDRPDYTVVTGEWEVGRIYETRGGPDNLRWFWSMTVNGPMTRAEGVGEAGGNRMTRLEQRGAVAFASTIWLWRGSRSLVHRRWIQRVTLPLA